MSRRTTPARSVREPLDRGPSFRELEILRIVWKLGRPATTREIYDESVKTVTRDYNTVSTLLQRLREKGYLTISEIRGRNLVHESTGDFKADLAAYLDELLDEVLETLPEAREILRRKLELEAGKPQAQSRSKR